MNDRRYKGRQGTSKSRFSSDTVLTERLYAFLSNIPLTEKSALPEKDMILDALFN